jgi:hypothetical protein
VLRRDKLGESAPPRFTPTGAIWPETKKRTMAKVLAFCGDGFIDPAAIKKN